MQEAPFPELKAQRKEVIMAKTLVWAVGDLCLVLVLCQRVPCAKKWSRESKPLPSCHFVLVQGAGCFGEEPPGKGGGGEERRGRACGGRDLMLLEIALVSCATLQLS